MTWILNKRYFQLPASFFIISNLNFIPFHFSSCQNSIRTRSPKRRKTKKKKYARTIFIIIFFFLAFSLHLYQRTGHHSVIIALLSPKHLYGNEIIESVKKKIINGYFEYNRPKRKEAWIEDGNMLVNLWCRPTYAQRKCENAYDGVEEKKL